MSNILQHKSIGLMKPTHGHQPSKLTGVIGPVDVLIDRCQQWKHVTKSLLHYYKGLAAIETASAKSTLALTDVIQVPFHEGHHFLGEGGQQEVLYEVRDKTKDLAEHHTALAEMISKTTVAELEGVRTSLKAHIAAIEKEAGVLASEVEKERAIGLQHLTHLQSGIETFENSQVHMMAKDDPYTAHHQTMTQLTKLVHKENDLQASLIRFQQMQPEFETGIATSIQSACRVHDEAQARTRLALEKVHNEIAACLQRVEPDAEYKFYASHEGAVMDPNTPYRTTEALTFPGMNHAATIPIKEGPMERKRRYTKGYKEAYYVLSASGYLHERRSSAAEAIKPVFSLFLPECSLGAHAKESDKSHKWHIEGNKAINSSVEGKVKTSLRFGGKEIAYTFRARTHLEMTGWWSEMDKLSRDTKAAPTSSSPSGKAFATRVSVAVANVGMAAPPSTTTDHAISTGLADDVGSPSNPTPIAAAHSRSAVVAAPIAHSSISSREAAQEEEDSDEEGGSSAEEEEELARQNLAHPTASTSVPVAFSGQKHGAESVAETLPIYSGSGVTPAEKAALQEKAKPGVLGAFFGSSAASGSSTSS
ncbi:hypothetical protein RQP46_004088 [Phenoliferia psychrophenolica]